ncbi:histidinol-phosphatase [Flavobacterium sp.]|uniref:histidinol-phosphatase n=1 Tax=Flavobacterium sp. TaxID=239 RepID=UPI003526F201
MQKILFVDRDGTIIKETEDERIDSFEKLAFYPKALHYLAKISKKLNFKIVMVTNQDGLGTDYLPYEKFNPVQDFVVKSFENEGVIFKEILIDTTFPNENASTRKPQTGLITHYIENPKYDLKHSFMIGDRLTDVEFAKNFGGKAIYINDKTHLGTTEISVKQEELQPFIAIETNNWKKIYNFLKKKS